MEFDSFDNKEFNEYAEEVKKRWETTKEYEEFNKKTIKKTNNEIKENAIEFMEIFTELGKLKNCLPSDKEVQEKISDLQRFITDNYYNCTREILKGLGQMYISDERMKKNID